LDLDIKPSAIARLDYSTHPEVTPTKNQLNWPAFKDLPTDHVVAYLQQTQNFPKVYAQIVFSGGTLAEQPHERGGCMLLMSFLRRCRPEFIQKMESLGIKLDDYVVSCAMGLTLECLAEDFEQAITDVQAMFCADHFHSKDHQMIFEREKKAQIAHIKLNEDDLQKQAFRHFRQLFFGLHPLKDPAVGPLEIVERLTLQDIHNLYQRLMVQSNLRLVVAGDCQEKWAWHALKGFSSFMPVGQDMHFESSFVPVSQKNEVIEVEDRSQAIVFEGYPIPGYAQPGADRYIMAVVIELLNAMSGILFSSIREAGLGYYAAGSVIKGWDRSCFVLYAGTQPGQQQAVYERFDKALEKLQNGKIDLKSLERAKTSLGVQHKMQLQTLSGRGELASGYLMYRQPINDWQQYENRIDAVSIDSIQAFALTWMQPKNRVRLVVCGR